MTATPRLDGVSAATNFVAGLGGVDVTPETLRWALARTRESEGRGGGVPDAEAEVNRCDGFAERLLQHRSRRGSLQRQVGARLERIVHQGHAGPACQRGERLVLRHVGQHQ